MIENALAYIYTSYTSSYYLNKIVTKQFLIKGFYGGGI